MTRRRDKYMYYAPCDRTVARMTIYFDTPSNGNARASHWRGQPASRTTGEGMYAYLAPRAAPTILDDPPAVAEPSRRPGRLRALRNCLAHRLARCVSRHNEAQDHTATNTECATNIPEPTEDHSHANGSTRSSIFSSILTHEHNAEADVSRRLQWLEDNLARFSVRLDGVERRTHNGPSVASHGLPPDIHGSQERHTASGLNDARTARPGHVGSACLPPRTPIIRSPAPTALASESCDGTDAGPPSMSTPLSGSPPGLPTHWQGTRKTSIAPVAPISVNFSGQSIATSSLDTFEAWNGTPPETYHGVLNAMPLPMVPPLPRARNGSFTNGLCPSLPPDGVWDDANASLQQSYEDSGWAMPPPPLQLPIPLPDVDDPEIELTPKRLTVYPPTVHGRPSSLGLDVPLCLPSPIQPHPQYEKHYRYHQFWEEWDLATLLNAERTQIQRTQVQHTQVLTPMRLSRRPDPQMIEYHHAVSALLTRKRADARLRRMLFGAKSLWPSIHPASGLGYPGLPAEAPRQSTADAPPKLARAQMNAQSVGVGLASTVEDNNSLSNPTIALDSSIERPTVAADVDRPLVSTSVPTATVPSIRTSDPSAMPATRGSTTSDKEKHHILTYIGGLKVSRTCAGLRLVIDVDTPDHSKPNCSTYFYGDFELAMESLRGVLEVDGRPHNLTELSLRISRLRDRKDHDIMMTVVSQLGDFLRYFHLVEVHMQCADKVNWSVDLGAARHKFRQLRHLRISGHAQPERFECFPLERVVRLDYETCLPGLVLHGQNSAPSDVQAVHQSYLRAASEPPFSVFLSFFFIRKNSYVLLVM
ncbi:hypothetical protein EV715DRAFT_211047 [Schizophyllum commune]